MKAATTPGPWRADVVDCTVYSATDGVRVAVVAGDGTNADANARLIAAAPELREALRELAEGGASYTEHDGCVYCGGGFDNYRGVEKHAEECPILTARAALAKADGKDE